MKLYLKVTRDKFELPVAVAESPKELAIMLGTTKNNVLSSISKKRRTWVMVEVEDGEE